MKLGGNAIPILSCEDALRRSGEVAPWQPYLVALCVCGIVLALARHKRTLLYH